VDVENLTAWPRVDSLEERLELRISEILPFHIGLEPDADRAESVEGVLGFSNGFLSVRKRYLSVEAESTWVCTAVGSGNLVHESSERNRQDLVSSIDIGTWSGEREDGVLDALALHEVELIGHSPVWNRISPNLWIQGLVPSGGDVGMRVDNIGERRLATHKATDEPPRPWSRLRRRRSGALAYVSSISAIAAARTTSSSASRLMSSAAALVKISSVTFCAATKENEGIRRAARAKRWDVFIL